MIKRPHCCALVIGLLLLLLAVVLVLRVNHASHTPAAQQAARVAQVMTHLENRGCLTCHQTTAAAPLPLMVAQRHNSPAESYQDRLASASPDAIQAAVDTELYDLGTRLLALPDQQVSRADAAVNAFVQVYAETRVTPADTMSLQQVVQQLARLNTLLQLHENQASPYQVARRTLTPSGCDAMVLASWTISPPPVACATVSLLGDVGRAGWVLADIWQDEIPVEIVFATQRRGPPSDASWDSVWYREAAIA